MITKHRIRRSRTQPQPGTVGAPFLGAFRTIVSDISAGGGTAEISAVKMNEAGIDELQQVWTPNKNIDVAALKLSDGTEERPIESAVINIDGNKILVVFSDSYSSVFLEVIPGHPALVSSRGMACGGAYGLG